jgi:hypothetical protein
LTGEGSETDLHVGGAERERLRRENSSLRRELEKLRQTSSRAALGGGKTAEQERLEAEGETAEEPPAEEPGDGEPPAEEPDGGESETGPPPAGEGTPPGDGPSDEPVPGYSELRADDARNLIKNADRGTVEAILAYEQSTGGANRSTVISAGEQRLDQLANDQGSGNGE